MKFTREELVARTLAGDYRAIARCITKIESGDLEAARLAASMRRARGRAHVVGVTGSPGAGKSTLVNAMATCYRALGMKVAILAVDPSSPFSGGAILGDRIRMNQAADDPTIFIRSMATRGSLGGLAKATLESVHVLDCAGFDVVLVETVGVGQAEVDIVRTADTCVVVLVPGMGDSVQIIKAGLMEIADIFVVNKADRDGALLLEKDLYTLLSLEEFAPDQWKPKILKSVATSGEGISEIVEGAVAHLAWLESSKAGYSRRLRIVSQTISTLISERVSRMVLAGEEDAIRELSKRCVARALTPLEAVQEFLATRTDKLRFENK
jgi:LAO/AO transport system kinase